MGPNALFSIIKAPILMLWTAPQAANQLPRARSPKHRNTVQEEQSALLEDANLEREVQRERERDRERERESE